METNRWYASGIPTNIWFDSIPIEDTSETNSVKYPIISSVVYKIISNITTKTFKV